MELSIVTIPLISYFKNVRKNECEKKTPERTPTIVTIPLISYFKNVRKNVHNLKKRKAGGIWPGPGAEAVTATAEIAQAGMTGNG